MRYLPPITQQNPTRFDLGVPREVIAKLSLALNIPDILTIFDAAQLGDHDAGRQLANELPRLICRIAASGQWNEPEDLTLISTAIVQAYPSEDFESKIDIPPQASTHSQSLNKKHKHQPKWRPIARNVDFPIKRLSEATIEVLDLLDRVLIRGEGWGPDDPQRGAHLNVTLFPGLLSQNGLHFSTRTYQRAIKQLLQLGLITQVGTDLSGARIVTPAWWTVVCSSNPATIWENARDYLQAQSATPPPPCRTDDGTLTGPCRPSVALPRPPSNQANSMSYHIDIIGVGVTDPRTSNSKTYNSRHLSQCCDPLAHWIGHMANDATPT